MLTVLDAAAFGGSQTQTFSYDALNRLLTAQAAGGSHGVYTVRSYSYNNAGNITSFESAALGYNDAAHKHAVTHVAGAQRCWYDANGNATRRVNGTQDITLAYDAENRVTSITGSGINASYVYDGDGKRVKATVGSTTTVYIGNYCERDNGTTVRKYCYVGAVRVAMRTGGQTYYLLGDHLGGTNVTANSSGGQFSKLLYKPWGETRFTTGTTPTTWRFTGQREDATIWLYYFNARYLDPQLGRFIQPDTIVPEPGQLVRLAAPQPGPQSLNRYPHVCNHHSGTPIPADARPAMRLPTNLPAGLHDATLPGFQSLSASCPETRLCSLHPALPSSTAAVHGRAGACLRQRFCC